LRREGLTILKVVDGRFIDAGVSAYGYYVSRDP
jgi:hypothetical protein